MNGYREDNSNCCCYFHPKEVFVGVCPFCLTERLLMLAAKQGRGHGHVHYFLPSKANLESQGITPSRKPSISLPKIFALGSLINRLEFRHWKSDNSDKSHVTSSPEESFISIKFEDNGAASWEKGNVSKVSMEQCTKSFNHNYNNNTSHKRSKKIQDNKEMTMNVIEHAKPRVLLRWRKWIGHLFQLIRCKRSKRGNVCHVGTKVRKGWIRTLTKRRTNE